MAYIDIADLRAEGITDPPFNNAHLEERIALACLTVDVISRMFFEEKVDHTFVMDGRGHDTLCLPYPPKTTDSITLIETGVHTSGGTQWCEVDPVYWEVDMPEIPDGRFRPKVVHLTSMVWPRGKRNIRLTGTFGFVEPDGSVPDFVKDMCKRIAMWLMPEIGDAEAQRSSRIVEESLDKYKYKLSDPVNVRAGMFGDPFISHWVSMFRGTKAMAV